MPMLRRHILLAASAAAALALSAGVLAAPGPEAQLPVGWSHAEINVIGARGKPHTLIYDRGRVVSVGISSLTLKERDGSVVTVEVAPNAVVKINGRRATLAQVTPRFNARMVSVDGRPAKQVLATLPPKRLRQARSSWATP